MDFAGLDQAKDERFGVVKVWIDQIRLGANNRNWFVGKGCGQRLFGTATFNADLDGVAGFGVFVQPIFKSFASDDWFVVERFDDVIGLQASDRGGGVTTDRDNGGFTGGVNGVEAAEVAAFGGEVAKANLLFRIAEVQFYLVKCATVLVYGY